MRNTGLFTGPSPGSGPYLCGSTGAGQYKRPRILTPFGPLLGETRRVSPGRRQAPRPGKLPWRARDDGGRVSGVRFAVWAPSARRVSVVGDFNTWDGRRHPMRLRHEAGVWEIFVPRLAPGALYKYELLGPTASLYR